MNISLRNRTDETVKIYFEKANRPEIKKVLPQKAQTVEEALEDYRASLLSADSETNRRAKSEIGICGEI